MRGRTRWCVAVEVREEGAGAQANGGSGPTVAALNQLTVPQAQAAFDSLSGEGITATQNVAFNSTSFFTGAMSGQTTGTASDNGVNPH